MADKIYIINDHIEVEEKYLKMTKEERQKAIEAIIQEDKQKKQISPK